VKQVKREASSVNGDEAVYMEEVGSQPPEVEVPLPTNPITMPSPQTITFNMSTEMIDEHREAFYQKLLNCSVAVLSSYTPPLSNANLKSKVCIPGCFWYSLLQSANMN
jgi:hypothetical protein